MGQGTDIRAVSLNSDIYQSGIETHVQRLTSHGWSPDRADAAFLNVGSTRRALRHAILQTESVQQQKS
jgi:hypothetical protein